MNHLASYGVNPLISGLWSGFFNRLSSEKLKAFLMGLDSTDEGVKKLKLSMLKVKRVINDAEIKQHTDPFVKEWLSDVILALCEAEDVVDDYETAVMMEHISPFDPLSSTLDHFGIDLAAAGSFVGHAIAALDPFHEGIDTKLAELNAKFNDYVDLIDPLGLRYEHFKDPSSSSFMYMPETSSLTDVGDILGRDSQRDTIVEILKTCAGVPEVNDHSIAVKGKSSSPSPPIESITVIAITGMPGIGKTTLAQLVYNDHHIADIFDDNKVWLCLMQDFNLIMILKSILAAIHSANNNVHFSPLFSSSDSYLANKLDLIQKDLRKILVGKRILIILDGVRKMIQDDVWKHLLRSIGTAASGSAIILTTSNDSIATRLHPSYALRLEELPNDDCWKLFRKEAYPNADLDEKWKFICEKIVAKCKGLPIAIKALGQLFKNTPKAKEKENIATSPIWDLHQDSERKQPILAALWLSYEYLPGELKPCFAYCSMFPKSHQFDKKELVFLWMAQGFINQVGDEGRMMNEIGNTYFDELKVRSFFQVSFANKNYFVMHDLFHDLATYVMRGFGFMLKLDNSPAVNRRLLYFSFEKSNYDTSERLRLTACKNWLRTFLPIETFTNSKSYLSCDMVQSLQQFSCLRVFSLRGYRITCVPPSIDCLKHLRYLDLSHTLLDDLPDSVGYLIHLQVLLLSNCSHLKMLPMTIKHLSSLAYLDIHGSMIKEMPDDFGRLCTLQILSNFVIGKDRGKSIRELGNLWQLSESLRISGLENVIDEADASAARLSKKTSLEELLMGFGYVDYQTASKQKVVLGALQPPVGLKTLSICGYGGDVLPNWLGNMAFLHLEYLCLEQCFRCVELSTLGNLPSLKHLTVQNFREMTICDLTSSPPFISLVTLKFSDLKMWRHWHTTNGDISTFPCLQELLLKDCPILEVDLSPVNLFPSLKRLVIVDCPMLSGSIPRTPSLRELTIYGPVQMEISENLAHLTQLTKLHLGFKRHDDFNFREGHVGSDSIARIQEATNQLIALQDLFIDACKIEVRLLGRSAWRLPSSVTSLTVRGFIVDSLDFLEHCRHLKYLDIDSFDSPLLFPEGQPQCLEYLWLTRCYKLKESPIITAGDDRGMQNLIDLKIDDCSDLETLPARIAGNFLPARCLTTLAFYWCANLRELPQGMDANFPCLKFLCIDSCLLFNSFGGSNLPPKLETMLLRLNLELESFPDMITCESLQRLHISSCRNLNRFAAGSLPRNLLSLKITKSPMAFFDMVECLESLEVDYHEEHMRALNRLTSLKELSINKVKSWKFPEHDLPKSLTILNINDSQDLTTINCRVLNRILALRELNFSSCENLKELSDGELPKSLCRLSLRQCPYLKKKCSRPDGAYVKSEMISHITCLELFE